MVHIRKCINSFCYAFKGLKLLVGSQNNARVHLLATVVALNAGFFLNILKTEWLWLLLAIALVWITEAVNTATEKLVDIISPEYNAKAGQVKDLAAAAVIIAGLFAFITGLILFTPYIYTFFYRS